MANTRVTRKYVPVIAPLFFRYSIKVFLGGSQEAVAKNFGTVFVFFDFGHCLDCYLVSGV